MKGAEEKRGFAMFKSKISRRLVIPFLILMAASISLLGGYLLHFFYGEHMQQQEAELRRADGLVDTLLSGVLLQDEKKQQAEALQLEKNLQDISERTGMRITVVRADGRVLADSSEPAEHMGNHLERPEIQGILHTPVQDTAIRWSETLNENMLYVATPVYDRSGELQGFIRTALPLTPIEASFAHTREVVLWALLVTALLTILVGLLLAHRQIRPIRQMTEDAFCIIHGDLTKRLEIYTGDELEILAHTINQLTNKLSAKIRALSAAAHERALILEHMDNGVLLLDGRGMIRLVNRRAQEIFALRDTDIGQSSVQALGSIQLSTAAREAAQSGDPQSFILVSEVGGQGKKTFSVFLAPFTEGTRQQVVCVFHDISLLQELSVRQSEFVSNAAHELATPLTSISGFAETLLEDDFSEPEQSRKFLGIIHHEAQRMGRLVQELLQLARLEREDYRRQIKTEAIDAMRLPALAAQRMEPQVSEKKQQFQIAAEEKPAYIEANADLMLQILLNISENAVKYTPAGGTITLSCYREESSVCFCIRDTGIGIAPEDQSRIFERFYRVDKARAGGGSGLGLSLVQFLVRLFDGTIDVKSQTGSGTSFILRFPTDTDR